MLGRTRRMRDLLKRLKIQRRGETPSARTERTSHGEFKDYCIPTDWLDEEQERELVAVGMDVQRVDPKAIFGWDDIERFCVIRGSV